MEFTERLVNAVMEVALTLSTTSCGHCEYDEAQGVLIRHCDKCCRRIVDKINAILDKHTKALDKQREIA